MITRLAIVNIYPLDYPGGLEVYSRALIGLFPDNTTFICASKVNWLNRFKCLSILILSLKCIACRIRQRDVVFVFNGLTGALGLLFRRSVNVFHGTNAEIVQRGGVRGLKRLYYLLEVLPLERLSTLAPNRKVFVSRQCEREFLVHYGVSGGSVIHNPVLDDFKVDWDPFRTYPQKKHVLFVGRWEHNKGADIFLSLALASDKSRFMFHALTQSPLDKNFPAQSVKHWSTVDHSLVGSFLYHADVVVLPSRSEGFGYTILEASLVSRLVITNRVGVAPDLQSTFSNLHIAASFGDYLALLEYSLNSASGVCREHTVHKYNNAVRSQYLSLMTEVANT